MTELTYRTSYLSLEVVLEEEVVGPAISLSLLQSCLSQWLLQ